jgi:hypothetical protein
MGESQGPAGETVGTEDDRTPEQVQREIEQTRTELGETVAELAAKTDVKTRAQRAVGNAKATVATKAGEVRQSAAAKKDELSASAQEAMPPSADVARRQVVSQARDHRLELAVLAAFGAGLIIGKWRG